MGRAPRRDGIPVAHQEPHNVFGLRGILPHRARAIVRAPDHRQIFGRQHGIRAYDKRSEEAVKLLDRHGRCRSCAPHEEARQPCQLGIIEADGGGWKQLGPCRSPRLLRTLVRRFHNQLLAAYVTPESWSGQYALSLRRERPRGGRR
jgi:hypothetical protein